MGLLWRAFSRLLCCWMLPTSACRCRGQQMVCRLWWEVEAIGGAGHEKGRAEGCECLWLDPLQLKIHLRLNK